MADERGVALVGVLVFMTLFGLMTSALLAQTDANLKVTSAVKTHDAKVYAADAGIEYGIQTLRADTTLCPDASFNGGAPYRLPDLAHPQPDGAAPVTVEVTCQTTAGFAPGGFGWAVITNDLAGNSVTTENGSTPKLINGPVFHTGTWNLAKPVAVSNGDVHHKASSCPAGAPPASLSIGPTPPYAYRCTTTAVPTVPHALPASIPPAAPPPTMSGGCRVLHPGTYTLATKPNLSGDVYLASGVYYFDDVGSLSVGSSLIGGQPATGETRSRTGTSSCDAVADPLDATGKGVEVILGGNSSIEVTNGTLELFTREPVGPETPGISLYQIPPGTAGGWTAATDPTANFFSISGGSTTEGIVRGAIYAPAGSTQIRGTNSSKAAFTGGINVYAVTLEASSSSTGLIVSIDTTPGERTTTIRATAKGVSGAKDIVTTAVFKVKNNAQRTARVQSWWTRN